MTLTAATRTWLALVLASSLASGEGMGPPAAEGAAPEPAPAALPALPDLPIQPGRVLDLDFSDDFPAPNRINRMRSRLKTSVAVTHPLPPAVPVAAPPPSRSWVYWTVGLSAMAAGGAAWYLHWDARSAPAPVRNDQVFTDDPD